MRSIAQIIIAVTILTAACGGGKMEWSGTLKGTTELMDHRDVTSSAYPRPAPLDTGTGSAELNAGSFHVLTFSSGSPLPDCMINFFPGSAKRDTTEKATAMEFKITEADRVRRKGTESPCVGVIDKGKPPVPIEIDHAQVSLKDDGEFFVSVDYRPVDVYTEKRVLYLQGQRGWF